MAVETVTVTKQEAQLIDEAVAIKKAMMEREAKAKAYVEKKRKIKSNYNLIVALLLGIGTIGLLFVEGKIG